MLPYEAPERVSEESYFEYKNDVDGILKQHIWSKIAYALCNAEYAIYYKSMMAMQQATTNGEELVGDLSLQFNHVRQEKITNELMDACSASKPTE